MFVGDEVRAAATQEAASGRLAALARGKTLTQAAQAAWDSGMPDPGYPGPLPAVFSRALWHGPRRRGPTTVLVLRWEAADPEGGAFPALDADLVLAPDADRATLVGLTGVFRFPPGTPSFGHSAAATVIRTFLARIASAIDDGNAFVAGTNGRRSPCSSR